MAACAPQRASPGEPACGPAAPAAFARAATRDLQRRRHDGGVTNRPHAISHGLCPPGTSWALRRERWVPSARRLDLTCGERRQCAVCEWPAEPFCSATTHFGASRVVLAQSHRPSQRRCYELLRPAHAAPASHRRAVCTCSLEPYITGSPPVSPIAPYPPPLTVPRPSLHATLTSHLPLTFRQPSAMLARGQPVCQ